MRIGVGIPSCPPAVVEMIELSFSGRVAVVTGGSRGIGKAIARTLVDGGAHVVISSRNEAHLAAAAAELGANCSWRVAHAADAEAARSCIDSILHEFGRLDILVNNAGINPTSGSILQTDERLAAKLSQVNQWAPVLWSQLAAAAWMWENGGSIVNITSIGGMKSEVGVGYYSSTKSALNHITQQLAAELAPRIRVNPVAPGLIATDLAAGLIASRGDELLRHIPMGRFGEPEDIAAATAFLCSDQSRWITGHILAVDGGALVGLAP